MASRVLLVETNAVPRESIREAMATSGIQCVWAAAAEALAALEQKAYDVVVVDDAMQDMDGFEFAEQIQSAHDIAVILLLTRYGRDDLDASSAYRKSNDFIFHPVHQEELILRLRRVLNDRRQFNRQKAELAELKKLAITDGLTTLYNSRHFFGQLEIEVDRASRYHHALSLLLLDIDHLKPYNDSYGHLEGDQVLARIGKLIDDSLRKMDSAYRYGGDEFTVILPSTKESEAMVVGERIRQAVAAEVFQPTADQGVHLTISIGATQYISGEKLSDFIHRADQTMYLAKEKGGNRVCSPPSDRF